MLGLALAFFLLVFLGRFGSAALGRFILDPVACLILLAAAPACWIYSILHAGGLFWFSGYPAWPRESGFSSLASPRGVNHDRSAVWGAPIPAVAVVECGPVVFAFRFLGLVNPSLKLQSLDRVDNLQSLHVVVLDAQSRCTRKEVKQ